MTVLLVLGMLRPALATTTYQVMIDTSAVKGTKGQLAFDFTKNGPLFNTVDILNFSTDSTLGVPITEGGLVEGDLILQINPAPFTRINGGFFFNELVVIPMPFGNTITFTLRLSENHTAGQVPDQFALFLLNEAGLPLFPTSDPLGADALFTIDITGVAGGDLQVFSPTIFTPPNSLQITVPSPNLPPVCGGAQASPNGLWPPNHQLVQVGIVGVTDPEGDPVTLTVTKVTQDEPVNGLGDGDTSPDAVIQGAKVQLRAERAGSGNGRVYQVSFTANDGHGGSCTGAVTVCVPHDQGDRSCIDDGQAFDSTQP